ncbi:Cytidylate kinase [Clostridium liquoris]|uniref:Cytidylate kinase n=1 Tax=Clostridium liquoris TaxID=1289519 RepID=A0A2T0B518_9CLOT|nr:(d)CMP kinase [Clostridium liquoris]PRR78887.1 Cytidylate kinase [Clostridium liquoris]
MRIAVAVDGPAGAGKSTIAKVLAKRFNLMYIDTGAMYRGVTLLSKRNNVSPEDTDILCRLIKSLEMHFSNDRLIINGEDVSEEIRKPEISNNVSLYAAIPEVRELLVQLQKEMSKKYDVVMDGRDIGTVVLSEAPFKFYLTASPEVRAKRRYDELLENGINVEYNNIFQDIIKRDFIDTTRKANPLKKADDAIEIDTSNLTVLKVVDKMSNYIRRKMSNQL